MPLSGEIIGINKTLANNPEVVNSAPFESGWIIKIKFSHPSELEELLSVEDYLKIIQNDKL